MPSSELRHTAVTGSLLQAASQFASESGFLAADEMHAEHISQTDLAKAERGLGQGASYLMSGPAIYFARTSVPGRPHMLVNMK